MLKTITTALGMIQLIGAGVGACDGFKGRITSHGNTSMGWDGAVKGFCLGFITTPSALLSLIDFRFNNNLNNRITWNIGGGARSIEVFNRRSGKQ